MKRSAIKRKPRPSSPEERAWSEAVRSLEYCALDGVYGVQWCHRDYGKGMGMKTHPWETAPLCPACHRELTDGTMYNRDEKRALMDRAIVNTHTKLILMGKLVLGD